MKSTIRKGKRWNNNSGQVKGRDEVENKKREEMK